MCTPTINIQKRKNVTVTVRPYDSYMNVCHVPGMYECMYMYVCMNMYVCMYVYV